MVEQLAKLGEYFELDEIQVKQFEALGPLYKEWNEQINVISRKDIDNIYERHVLHSLSIVKCFDFNEGTDILDLGTGGGFPGIPLAIMFPDVNFHLIDARNKKILVVNEVIHALGLENVKAEHKRAEELKTKYDFIVTRAVAKLDKLMLWSKPLFKKDHYNIMPNGLIALKGGDIKNLKKEISKREYLEEYDISDFYSEAYFEEKYVIYVQG